jgi:TolB protein
MTHEQALQRLHAAADGLLGQSERAEFEAHLAECAECRALAAELDSLQLALSHTLRARWDAHPIPADLPRKVVNRVRQSTLRQPFLRVAGALVGVAALAALILFFGALFGGTSAGPGTLSTGVVPPATASPATLGGVNGWIAFESTRDGNAEIYVMRADGSHQLNLTNNPAADFAPAWSPDGARLAFISDRSGQQEIYVMPAPVAQAQVNVEAALRGADGSGATQLTGGLTSLWSPLSWSPDGSRLAITRGPANFPNDREEIDIYLVSADGSGTVSVIQNPQSDFAPKWSPDGRRIAFTGLRSANNALYAVNPDGTGLTTLGWEGGRDAGAYAWSPDGSRVAYFSVSRQRYGDYRDEVRIVAADGSNEKTILALERPERPVYSDLAWSPDGTRLIFTSTHEGDADGSRRVYIYMMWADGSGLTRLTSDSARYAEPRWSPDGKWIVFTSDQDAPTDIYLMNVENAIRSPGTLTPIRLTITGKDHDPQWQPVGGPSVELAAQPSPVPTPTPPPAVRVLGVHQVQSGETVRCIASAYGVAASAIVRLNRLGDPPQLHSGPVLIPDVKGEDYEAGPACSPQFPSPYSLDPEVTVPAPITFPFALKSEGISARPNFANTAGCDWLGMGGQAFARSGEPLAGLVVHLEGGSVVWDTLTGSQLEYGPGGYEIQIADYIATTTGVYRVQLRDPRGQPLSEWIAVDTFADCSKNLLVVNFAQR